MNEKSKKNISDEQENFSKTSSVAVISSKVLIPGLSRKINGNILDTDEGRTSTNGPEHKKQMTMNKALQPRGDIHRLYV